MRVIMKMKGLYVFFLSQLLVGWIIHGQDGCLRLSSFPSQAQNGELFTLICTSNITGQALQNVTWYRSGDLMFRTCPTSSPGNSDIINFKPMFVGLINASCSGNQHNVTLKFNSTIDYGYIWACRGTTPGRTSNALSLGANSNTSSSDGLNGQTCISVTTETNTAASVTSLTSPTKKSSTEMVTSFPTRVKGLRAELIFIIVGIVVGALVFAVLLVILCVQCSSRRKASKEVTAPTIVASNGIEPADEYDAEKLVMQDNVLYVGLIELTGTHLCKGEDTVSEELHSKVKRKSETDGRTTVDH